MAASITKKQRVRAIGDIQDQLKGAKGVIDSLQKELRFAHERIRDMKLASEVEIRRRCKESEEHIREALYAADRAVRLANADCRIAISKREALYAADRAVRLANADCRIAISKRDEMEERLHGLEQAYLAAQESSRDMARVATQISEMALAIAAGLRPCTEHQTATTPEPPTA